MLNGPMPRLRLVTFVWICLCWASGCSRAYGSNLDGVWLGDSVENFEEQHLAVAAGWIKGTALTFRRGELTIKISERGERVAPYRVVKADARALTVAVLEEDGEPSVMRLSLDSEDTLRWHLSEGRSLVLRRQ